MMSAWNQSNIKAAGSNTSAVPERRSRPAAAPDMVAAVKPGAQKRSLISINRHLAGRALLARMDWIRCRLAFMIGPVAVALACSSSARAQELTLGGTGGSLATMRILGDAFSKANPGTRLKIVPSLGSTGGIEA